MKNLDDIAQKALNNGKISASEALDVIKAPDDMLFGLLARAEKVRRKFKSNKVKLCSIVNARSGSCSENCSFCAQSAHHGGNAVTYDLISEDDMFRAAAGSEKEMKSTCFSIVTSGRSVDKSQDVKAISGALKKISKDTKMNKCVSLGTLDKEAMLELKASGLTKLHHNLETSESNFPNICTTHDYADRIRTVKLAKEVGLKVCSGGIFNVGESVEQRIELGLALRDLDVESVPINILHPIPGTPAADNYRPIRPFDVLKLIMAYRFLMPSKDIGLFGGREESLGSLQPLLFAAGANVILIGDYLTTKGQSPQKDLQMISDLGLEVEDGICH